MKFEDEPQLAPGPDIRHSWSKFYNLSEYYFYLYPVQLHAAE